FSGLPRLGGLMLFIHSVRSKVVLLSMIVAVAMSSGVGVVGLLNSPARASSPSGLAPQNVSRRIVQPSKAFVPGSKRLGKFSSVPRAAHESLRAVKATASSALGKRVTTRVSHQRGGRPA